MLAAQCGDRRRGRDAGRQCGRHRQPGHPPPPRARARSRQRSARSAGDGIGRVARRRPRSRPRSPAASSALSTIAERGLIADAALMLQGRTRVLGEAAAPRTASPLPAQPLQQLWRRDRNWPGSPNLICAALTPARVPAPELAVDLADVVAAPRQQLLQLLGLLERPFRDLCAAAAHTPARRRAGPPDARRSAHSSATGSTSGRPGSSRRRGTPARSGPSAAPARPAWRRPAAAGR